MNLQAMAGHACCAARGGKWDHQLGPGSHPRCDTEEAGREIGVGEGLAGKVEARQVEVVEHGALAARPPALIPLMALDDAVEGRLVDPLARAFDELLSVCVHCAGSGVRRRRRPLPWRRRAMLYSAMPYSWMIKAKKSLGGRRMLPRWHGLAICGITADLSEESLR